MSFKGHRPDMFGLQCLGQPRNCPGRSSGNRARVPRVCARFSDISRVLAGCCERVPRASPGSPDMCR
eukprot:7543221-Lingulodinium_polyedra.AAC.1